MKWKVEGVIVGKGNDNLDNTAQVDEEPGEITPRPSRTQKKKAVEALQKLGERMVSLSREQLAGMDLPRELLEAVVFAQRTSKHGARRRQMQYIGALMRDVDSEAIRNALAAIDAGEYELQKRFHLAEAWRDGLVRGDDALINTIVARCPAADRQRLGQLARSARKKGSTQARQTPAAARKLFRYLRELLDDNAGRPKDR